MKYTESLWRNITCVECNSSENVKTIEIGNENLNSGYYNLNLCKECRDKLKRLLEE